MIKKILIFLTLIVLVIIGYIVYNNHKTTPTGTSVNIVNVDDLGVNLSGAGLQVINQNNDNNNNFLNIEGMNNPMCNFINDENYLDEQLDKLK